MKGRVRVIGALFMIAALIVMMLPAPEADAATTSASDFKMDGTTLVKYKGTDTSVSVPDTVEIIGESAFEGNTTVEQVVIPDSVKEIQPYAFWGCEKLSTIVLGKGLTEIDDYAFTGCKGLSKMLIPSNVKSIGIMAFADCVNMETITIPPETQNIHETAFDGCYKLVIKCEKGSKAEDYAEAFYERQKEMPEYEDVNNYNPSDPNANGGGTVVEPPVVTPSPSVPEETPGRVLGSTKVVGNQAVVFMDNTAGQVYGGQGSVSVVNSQSTPRASKDTIVSMDTIVKYTVVDGRVVADQAYYRSKDIKQYTLPSGIQEVGQFSFARSSLERLTVPEGVNIISYGAFYHCENLSEVSLPQSIICVEPKAFVHTAWVDNFLAGSGGGDSFLVSGATLVAYRGNSSDVTLPEGVKVIAGEAFYGHDEIKSVTLPDSLLVVGEGAFEGCSSLRELVWNSKVTDIKDRAFYGTGMTDVALPASVERMGLLAFPQNAKLAFEGGQPEGTHEVSAERLSNEDYRGLGGTGEEPGLSVRGLPDNAFAKLEGASRRYTLAVKQVTDNGEMKRAFERIDGQSMPDGMVLYELILCDNSNIPLTKLGRQPLTVTLPVPEQLCSEQLRMVALDRNGQLESVDCVRLLVDGKDCVRFSTSNLYLFGLYGTGEAMEPSDVIEEATIFSSMSAAPDGQLTEQAAQGMPMALKLGSGICLFLLGGTLLLWSFRR